MNYTHYDLGQQPAGAVARVTLDGTEANVMLLDSHNLGQYRRGGRFRYFGGHVRRSPVVLEVPNAGHWHVVVDLGGFGGSVRSSVEVVS